MLISIQTDYREHPSGIPDLLSKDRGVSLQVVSLSAGDYIINGCIGVERKSAEDFVQSILSNRIFAQVAKLKQSVSRPLLIVEGNPYTTSHKIHPGAIRGALMSVLISWQIPVIFSKNKEDTVALLLMAAKQDLKTLTQQSIPKNYRPKKLVNSQLFFLQGIPGVGQVLAFGLLNKFGSLKTIINATEEELMQIEGIGKNKAKKIFGFISAQFHTNI